MTIVEELRARTREDVYLSDLCARAADEIERLTDERDKFREEFERAQAEADLFCEDRDRAERACHELRRLQKMDAYMIDRLCKERDAVRSGREDAAETIGRLCGVSADRPVTIDDLRELLAALDRNEPPRRSQSKRMDALHAWLRRVCK